MVRTLKHIHERNESRERLPETFLVSPYPWGNGSFYLEEPVLKGMTKVERCVSTKKKA